jgi:hypothetical protein
LADKPGDRTPALECGSDRRIIVNTAVKARLPFNIVFISNDKWDDYARETLKNNDLTEKIFIHYG